MPHVVRGPGPPAGRLSSASATLSAGSRPLAGSHLANAITPPDAGAFWLAIYPSLPAAHAKSRLVTRVDPPSRHRPCANSRKGWRGAGAIARQRLVTLIGRSVRSLPAACRRTACDVPGLPPTYRACACFKKSGRTAGCGHKASSTSCSLTICRVTSSNSLQKDGASRAWTLKAPITRAPSKKGWRTAGAITPPAARLSG